MTDEDERPRVVPVYMVTGGRTRPARDDIPWEAQLTLTNRGRVALPSLRREQARIVALCQRPMSLAEVAASLQLPISAAQILVSDLFDEGLLDLHQPSLSDDGRPEVDVLRRLITGLKAGS